MIGMVLAGVGYNLLVVPKTRHVEIDQSVMEQEQWKKIDKKGQVIGVAGPNLADWTGWLNTHESGEIRIRTDEKGRELKVRLYPWSYALSRIEVTSGKLHGFVDNSGKTVIEPIYEQVHPFYNGLAEVKRTSDSPWEIVEPTGRTVVTIDQAYEPFICGRSEGVSSDGLLLIRMARAFSDPSCYVLNIRNNQIAYLGSVDELSQFSEGVARFSSKRKSGFVNAKGELVVAPIYDFVKQFHEGLTMVLLNGQYSYIDKTGKKVISLPADCSAAGDFHEGMAAVALGGDSRDKNDPSFLSVRKNAKWSFIDNKGRTIIGAKFHVERDPNNGLVVETPEFSEGLCKVTITENNKLQTGFIDPIGNWVVPPKYSEASNFHEWDGQGMRRRRRFHATKMDREKNPKLLLSPGFVQSVFATVRADRNDKVSSATNSW